MISFLFALIVALNLADVYTTYRVLSRGGTEKNPLMAKVFSLVGFLPGLLLVKAVILAALWWAFVHQGLQGSFFIGLLVLICAVYIWVVVHNASEMRKQSDC